MRLTDVEGDLAVMWRRLDQRIRDLAAAEIRRELGSNFVAGQVAKAALPKSVTSATTPIAMTTGSTAPPVPLWSSDGSDYVYLSA